MKYDNKDIMKEISEIVNCSRNYVSSLIKYVPIVNKYKNRAKVKIYKYKNSKKMSIYISVNFLKKIGISEDVNIDDYVDIIVDDKNRKNNNRKA